MVVVHNAGLTGDTNNAEVSHYCLLVSCHKMFYLNLYIKSKRVLEWLWEIDEYSLIIHTIHACFLIFLMYCIDRLR